MSNEITIAIVQRFFDALDRLKADKKIRGKQTFTTRYEINKRNMYKCITEPTSKIFDPAWLYYLCTDYNVSPDWLLLGKGSFYSRSTKP